MNKFLSVVLALGLLLTSINFCAAANSTATQDEIALVENASQNVFVDSNFTVTPEKVYQLGTDRVVLFTVAGVDSDGPIIYIVCTEQNRDDPVVLTHCSYVQDASS